MTLSDAVARAFDTSHRLAEARAREEGAQATLRLRRAASKPTATASAGYSRTNHVDEFGFPSPDGGYRILYPDVPDNVLTRVAAQWPIYTSGRFDALERVAAAEASAVAADIDTARADLRFEVQRAYWALATSREAVRVLQESVERAEAQVRDARQRLDVGLVPPSDVLTFEAQRSREELQLIEAVTLRESSLIELRRLIGAEADTPIDLADPLDAPPLFTAVAGTAAATPVPAPPELAAVSARLVSEALQARPERQALSFRIEGARARTQAASSGNKPTIALGGGFDFSNPNPKIFPREEVWQASWDLGVNVNWTWFDSGRTRAEVAEAAAAARAAEERLKDLDTLVDADVRQRVLDLRSSLVSVRAAADGVRAAAEARRVIGERFAVGVATTTDVLIAQDQLLTAELARARALASVRLAEARLQRALGRP
ncbi:MAG: TolC family protein [Acidobacteriota bacterium]|nr:TolC family protein [Acidobacteriota bacterium]